MTIKHLIDHGYKEHPSTHGRLFQKRIGTSYFINVTVNVWPDGWTSFTPEVQFRLHDDRSVSIEAVQWFNTFTGKEDHDIRDAERYFAEEFATGRYKDNRREEDWAVTERE